VRVLNAYSAAVWLFSRREKKIEANLETI
jgi:hypothetical protein